jgi:hypothetical protein
MVRAFSKSELGSARFALPRNRGSARLRLRLAMRAAPRTAAGARTAVTPTGLRLTIGLARTQALRGQALPRLQRRRRFSGSVARACGLRSGSPVSSLPRPAAADVAVITFPCVCFRRQPTRLACFIQRAVKSAVFSPVQVRPGELSVYPSSYRGGEEGNRIAEAIGTWATLGGSASRRAATRVKLEQASKRCRERRPA